MLVVACAYVPPGSTRYTFRKLSVTSEQRVIYREAPPHGSPPEFHRRWYHYGIRKLL